VEVMADGARQKRERSATESLLSIALGLEAVVVFFITMAIFGLKVLEPALAFTGGAVLLVLFVLAAWALRFPKGVWLGAAMQLVLVATGFLLPALFFVAALFVALWVYCFVKGKQLDARSSTNKEKP
jgi:hypothetical protein